MRINCAYDHPWPHLPLPATLARLSAFGKLRESLISSKVFYLSASERNQMPSTRSIPAASTSSKLMPAASTDELRPRSRKDDFNHWSWITRASCFLLLVNHMEAYSDCKIATISSIRLSRLTVRRDLIGYLQVGHSWRPIRTHFSMQA
mmetsp:Transcript_28975/g.66464  ORF Transcript_28975/g.66464 Transcript_28975/m.66464 type:complete len:148 (-) Transcript_28975:3332-3775(-)